MTDPLLQQITRGIAELPLSLSPITIEKLQQYLLLLDKWNKAYNLTAVREIDKMVAYHLLDSLSLQPFLQGDMILDVGTGAGLPGIPLALANTDKQFVLLDSNGKKTRFIQHVILQLQLDNVEVVQARIEQYNPEKTVSTIVSRAFASLSDYHQAVKHLMTSDTVILAMKGKLPKQEIDELTTESVKIHSETLRVPGIDGERCVVIIQE